MVGAPRIQDYAILGDGRSAALVSRGGAVDWWCPERFDAPALLCRLLDADAGGSFALELPGGSAARRAYLPGTNVLRSAFEDGDAALELTDWMPFPAHGGSALVRRLEVLRGSAEVAVELRPTPAFASTAASFELEGSRAWIRWDGGACALDAPVPLRIEEGALRGRLELRAGEAATLRLALGAATQHAGADPAQELRETCAAWRRWSDALARAARDLPERDLVVRSGLLLKLLTYAPSGAPVAAPTTSLPAVLGGGRNWDYRLTWIRDTALSIEALMRLELHEEAMSFWPWLVDATGGGRELAVAYAVDGARPPEERELGHLRGHRGSRPVRVGNAAAFQRQLDVYGYVLDAAYQCQVRMGEPHDELRPLLSSCADAIVRSWREPDRGIWEVRSAPEHFLHSKLLCWVGLRCALELSERGWLDGDRSAWAREAEALAAAIPTRGWSPALGAFARAFGSDAPDASTLPLCFSGLLPGNDPRLAATVDAVRRELGAGDLVRRSREADGVEGEAAAFLPCSFWMVRALAAVGRRGAAAERFARLAARANDVGLLPEQIDPRDGDFRGNFPQAFTHLALIQAAADLAGRG